jgi:hypothetical protein
LALAAMNAHAADYAAFDKQHVGDSLDQTGYSVVWNDEFDTLQASRPGQGSGPWFSGVHAVLAQGEKMAAFPDPAFRINAGVLTLSTRLDSEDGKRVEAHLQTDDGRGHVAAFQNGYVEARIWLPRARGSHAGLWLLSQELGHGHVEVDVVEAYGAGDYGVHSSTHVWPTPPAEHRFRSNYSGKPDIYDGYHSYGVLATDSEFRFYYDSMELARIERLPEQRVPLYLLLSVFGNPTQPIVEPAAMLIDYVRVYAVRPTPPRELEAK